MSYALFCCLSSNWWHCFGNFFFQNGQGGTIEINELKMTRIFKTEDKFCIYVCGCACKTIHDKIWFWQVPRINRSDFVYMSCSRRVFFSDQPPWILTRSTVSYNGPLWFLLLGRSVDETLFLGLDHGPRFLLPHSNIL